MVPSSDVQKSTSDTGRTWQYAHDHTVQAAREALHRYYAGAINSLGWEQATGSWAPCVNSYYSIRDQR
jgi:hypothetical protein